MKSKKKLFIGAGIIIIIVIVILAVVSGKKQANAKDESGNTYYLSSEAVQVEDINAIIPTKGTVRAKNSVSIVSEMSSDIESIDVEVGDRVKEGEKLLTLDTTTLDKQIRDAELVLKEAKLNYQKTLNQNEKALAKRNAEAALSRATKNLEDTKILFKEGAVSIQAMSDAEASYEEAEYAYAVAMSNLKENDTSETLLSLQLESAQNAYNDLLELKEKAIIKAPISGVITRLDVNVHDLVSTGTVLASIETTSDLEIVSYIGEYDINQIKVGQKVAITGYSIGDATYQGLVTHVGASAEVQSVGQSTERSVEVIVEIEDKTAFKPNFTANLEIEVGVSKEALTVPYEAIVYREEGTYVYTVKDEIAKAHQVEIGVQGEIRLEIIASDINEDDRVLLEPPTEIEEGDHVMLLEEVSA
jgi:HlyD family secretion protein